MKNRNFNSDDNSETNNENNSDNKIDDIIKNIAISAANAEKAGAILLSFGYSTLFRAGNADIYDVVNENKPRISSFAISTFGQRFTLVGYILLYIAASKRLYEKVLANLYDDENNDLTAFRLIRDAYLGSIFVNYVRLIQFYIIANQELNQEL